jgi:hypothetical protein
MSCPSGVSLFSMTSSIRVATPMLVAPSVAAMKKRPGRREVDRQ